MQNRHVSEITRQLRAAKHRFTERGLNALIEWNRPGRRPSRLDGFIEEKPLPGGGTATVVLVLDPVAIDDTHTFRWGRPGIVYEIVEIAGLVQDEALGTRHYSQVTSDLSRRLRRPLP